MIHAELKNKLPREILNREDFLTSLVFGLLKYSHMRPILKEYLAKAILVSENTKSFSGSEALEDLFQHPFDVVFWERDTEYGEPDILLVGRDAVFVIEVKLGAEISGESQLRRYHTILQHRHKDKRHKYIIYLTADISCPELGANVTKGLENVLWWLSWYDLTSILGSHLQENDIRAEISQDLFNVLTRRQLSYFMGFSETPEDSSAETFFWNEETILITIPEIDIPGSHLFWKEK